ncbi:hypothetical protein [Paenibacillus arenilitoris]|uniref:Uncharacterized protein n=1 Tax=Paenibacillus arenilitoris TaxID=2772299 RepID=A0A927CJZ6_9BACL|nr:hypothetical protein [Paenibacillus arenilitoris]MBD2867998.1 hypothetical protein [Paenibacillus arenilitoris]
MLFVQAHKEVKAGMKAHMANERKQHNLELRKAARKQVLNARREVAATK